MIEAFWSPHAVRAAGPTPLADPHRLANAIIDYLEIFHNRQRRHSSLRFS
jgi:putative transposase